MRAAPRATMRRTKPGTDRLVADRCRDPPGAQHERRRRVGRAEILRVREAARERGSASPKGSVLGERDEQVLVVAVADHAVRADQEAPSCTCACGRRGAERTEAAPKSSGTREVARGSGWPETGSGPLDAARVDRLRPDDEIERALGQQLARLLEVDVRACAPGRGASRARRELPCTMPTRSVGASAARALERGDAEARRSRRRTPARARVASHVGERSRAPAAPPARASRRARRSRAPASAVSSERPAEIGDLHEERPIDEGVAEHAPGRAAGSSHSSATSGAGPASAIGQPRARTAR